MLVSDLTSFAPAVLQSGVGVLARSGDHSRVLAAANDASGELAVFDSNGKVVASPQAPLAGTISFAASNSDGSQFALAVTASGISKIPLLDSKLNTKATYATPGASGLLFSADGQSLYVAEPFGNTSVVSVLSASNLQASG